MKKILATTALAATTIGFAATAQAAVTDLSFYGNTDAPGSANAHVDTVGGVDKVGNVYRYKNITAGVDMLVTITGKSTGAVIGNVSGGEKFYNSALEDNFVLELSRSGDETDTWVSLNFAFVNSTDGTPASVADSILTFGDIDSFSGLSGTDYIEILPSSFAGGDILALPSTSELTQTAALHSSVWGADLADAIRILGDASYDGADRKYDNNEQVNLSASVSIDGISSFDLVWGYVGTPAHSRSMVMDGSYELENVNVVPEPASAALLGLGGLVLLAGVRRRR